ncbi:pentapeptide repeat-containing protein [Roseovarius indicus]|uniref:pentapeptide repeat-containing protein n=1 Tax=Roseovarius indicus TaxID=540747 RepID=UPI0011602335|nr:pentapeptide repeat-containing protein [Roseovarius indicus]
MNRRPVWTVARWLGPLFSIVMFLLFAMALSAAFVMLGHALFDFGLDAPRAGFGTGAVIVALLGAPFVIWRAIVAQKQADVAEQGHITDRINKAVEGLGTEKVVSRVWRNVTYKLDGEVRTGFEGRDEDFKLPEGAQNVERGEWKVADRTRPNLEVRIGAIYALERIAQDGDRDHVQIMEILCAYIRQNAPAPQTDDWPQLEIKESEDDGPLEADWGERLEAFREAQRRAQVGLKPREDIQVALTVLGRRRPEERLLEARRGDAAEDAAFIFDLQCPEYDGPEDGHDPSALDAYLKALGDWEKSLHGYEGYRLDLRNADLRGADLSGLNLNGAKLTGSFLQGADLGGAQLRGANLWDARLQGADVGEAQLQGANLVLTRLQGANLVEARLQGANFWKARLQGTQLWEARLQRASLVEVRSQGANLWEARLQGANLGRARLQGADLWEARLQVAFLREARLQGAFLVEARFDAQTDVTTATLRGAAVRSFDCSDVPQIAEHLEEMYGDGSVTLPKGVAWPKHWPEHALDGVAETEDGERIGLFIYEWRKWQADPGAYEPPKDADEG